MDSSSSPTTIKTTFKYNATQLQPILSVIETPLKYQIDLSFSSYLNHHQKDSDQEHHHSSASTPPPVVVDDSEINVFDAQKYFSEEPNNDLNPNPNPKQGNDESVDNLVSRLSSVSSVDRNFRTRSFHATPTASSEASWNSQIGLLSNPPGSIPVKLRNPSSSLKKSGNNSSSSISKWFFCKKCPCIGKKSVQVDDGNGNSSEKQSKKQSQIQRSHEILPKKSHQKVGSISNQVKLQPEINQFRVPNHRILATPNPNSIGGNFSFPILNKTAENEIPPRESLEVFQPPAENNNNNNNNNNSSSSVRKSIEDDVCSDASSDLFEIESFSTQTTTSNNYPQFYRRRDSIDDCPITPRTEFYAPSEVSIDWSVTTAEGFDKASMTNFSEIEEFTTNLRQKASMEEEEEGWKNGKNNSNGKKKLGNGLLLNCRHEKAVNVGPRPVKCIQEGPPLPLPLHVSSGGGSRPPKPSMGRPLPLPPTSSTTRSARLSLAFAA